MSKIKLESPVLKDGLRETVTLRTVAKLIVETNKEIKKLSKEVKTLTTTLTEMCTELKTGVEQTRESIRIADTSIKAIDKLADSVRAK